MKRPIWQSLFTDRVTSSNTLDQTVPGKNHTTLGTLPEISANTTHFSSFKTAPGKPNKSMQFTPRQNNHCISFTHADPTQHGVEN